MIVVVDLALEADGQVCADASPLVLVVALAVVGPAERSALFLR